MTNFTRFAVEGLRPNIPKLEASVRNSLMLVTALSPHIDYDKSAKVAHVAFEENLFLKEAAIKLGFLSGEDFDRFVRPEKMLGPD